MPSANPSGKPAAAQQKQAITQLAQTGKLEEARKRCVQLCEKHPNDAEAWFLLGAIHGANNDYVEAESCCRRALALAPDHAPLHFNLAVALAQQNKTREAAREFQQAIRLAPAYRDAHRELGNALSNLSDYAEAVASYEKAIELGEHGAVAFSGLAHAYRQTGRLDEAANMFQKALALEPDHEQTLHGYGRLLIHTYKFDRAIELLEAATRRRPRAIPLLLLLSIAYQEQGEADRARHIYERILKMDPQCVDAQVGLAGMLALQGEYDTARGMLEPVLREHPDNATAKTTFATFALQFKAAEQALELSEKEIAREDTPDKIKARFHFAIAKIREKEGDLDTAFHHYKLGNELRGAHFDHASFEHMFNLIMQSFSAEKIAALPRSSNESGNFIFIVGMPRSGTSLAEHILASHPAVHGAGELRDINYMVDSLHLKMGSPVPYPQCLDQIDTRLLNKLAQQYADQMKARAPSGFTHFTDKLPINFIHIGFIRLLFPNAPIVHCTRDPRDTCLSCYFQMFSGELPFAYSLSDLGKFYRLYEKMMAHWNGVMERPIHVLNYEAMVENQESETRKLVAYCGLDWDDDCLNFHNTRRTVATASYDQVRRPMYKGSVGRWKAYEKHLGPLLEALQPETKPT